MNQVGGIDLSFHGCQFTWDNNKEKATVIREQLDKAIVNRVSIDKFPATLVCHLNLEESNHALFSQRRWWKI